MKAPPTLDPSEKATLTDCPEPANGVQRLSLKVNFLWTATGNVVYAGCQWAIIVVLARLGSAEHVGQFALALAVTAPVVLFANLQLRAIQATDARGDYHFGDYLALRLATLFVAISVLTLVAFASGDGTAVSWTILAIGLAKAFESVSDIFYGLLQRQERMDRISKSMIMKGVLSLAAVSATLYVTGSVFWSAAAMAATWAMLLVLYDMRSGALVLTGRANVSSMLASHFIEQRPWEQRRKLAALARLGIPMGLVTMLISLNTNIPRYFIEHYLGTRELGVFAAIAYLMSVGTVVVSALGQSAGPRLAKHYTTSGIGEFRALLGKLVLLGAALGIAGVVVAVVAGEPFLTLLYGREYGEQSQLLFWLMMAAGVNYVASFLGWGMMAARRLHVQAPLYLLLSVIIVGASGLLIPAVGLIGASLAILVANLVQLAGSLIIIRGALRPAARKGDT